MTSTVSGAVQQAVVNVLQTMTGNRVQAQAIPQQNGVQPADVVITLPVTGNLAGTVMLGMSRPLAQQVGSAMLGKDAVNEAQAQDAIAELLNIIVGKTTGLLENTPYRFTFTSPPRVAERLGDLGVDSENGDGWVLPFATHNQRFEVALHLVPDNGSVARMAQSRTGPTPCSVFRL